MRRSQLYVPSNNEKMLRKVPQLEADSIVFDLEDSVPLNEKSGARELLKNVLKELDGLKEVCIRINPLGSAESIKDVREFSNVERVATFVVPKAEDSTSQSRLHRETGKDIIPLVETPLGLLSVQDLVRAEGVVGVSYGAGDLALSMHGTVQAYESNTYVKTVVVVAARAYGIDPIDKVYFDLRDIDGFRNEAIQSKGLGYVGKQVIHPNQIAVANEVFSPSPEELEWARRVVDAYDSAAARGMGAIKVDDALIDHVHYKIAKNLLGLR